MIHGPRDVFLISIEELKMKGSVEADKTRVWLGTSGDVSLLQMLIILKSRQVLSS